MINLKDAPVIAIDIETHDPDLKSKGPGVRRDGYVVGVALSNSVQSIYVPLAHRIGTNVDKARFMPWLKKELSGYTGVITGTNLLYDFDYLGHEGVDVSTARIEDILIAEPLIDENQRQYNLDRLGEKYLNRGKNDEALVAKYGKDWIKRIRDIPADEVEPYAVEDVVMPIGIREMQLDILHYERLMKVFDVECRLWHMLLYMRRLGVRVDLEAADKLSWDLTARATEIQYKIDKMAGYEVNVDASASIAKYFDKEKIPYPLTHKTKKPSFTKGFMEKHPHEFPRLITELRGMYKMKTTFLDGYIKKSHVNGRVHCEFNQLRSDEGGTVTGRFSSAKPNLQNIPSRDPILAPMIRGLFLPEEGMQWWQRDWSQIEFRLVVGYAEMLHKHNLMNGISAAPAIAQKFRDDPTTDYHNFVMELTGLERKPAKNFNFGIVYGMGLPLMASMVDMTVAEAKPLKDIYDKAVPFATKMLYGFSDNANAKGHVSTLLGRRRRFETFAPANYALRKMFPQNFATPEEVIATVEEFIKQQEQVWDDMLPGEERSKLGSDLTKWNRNKRAARAHTHKALNAVIQGGAADLMKYAMVKIWEAGITKHLPIHLTVHDELDGSIDVNNPLAVEALAEAQYIMENALEMMYEEFGQKLYRLDIPFIAEGEQGPDWGHCK